MKWVVIRGSLNGYEAMLTSYALGLKLVYTRLIGLVAIWEHLASPATSFQTLPGGPQKLRLNPSFSQFSPCPARCAVWPSVCRFHSYCCLPVPADPVFCATQSLPYLSPCFTSVPSGSSCMPLSYLDVWSS